VTATVEEPEVAKIENRGGERPGAGRPRSDRDDVAVKFDRAVAARARYVAEMKGLSMAEYLTEAARATVDRDFLEIEKPAGPPVRPRRRRAGDAE
jgi:hypothetical protein